MLLAPYLSLALGEVARRLYDASNRTVTMKRSLSAYLAAWPGREALEALGLGSRESSHLLRDEAGFRIQASLIGNEEP